VFVATVSVYGVGTLSAMYMVSELFQLIIIYSRKPGGRDSAVGVGGGGGSSILEFNVLRNEIWC
jgi:hypothetical protein